MNCKMECNGVRNGVYNRSRHGIIDSSACKLQKFNSPSPVSRISHQSESDLYLVPYFSSNIEKAAYVVNQFPIYRQFKDTHKSGNFPKIRRFSKAPTGLSKKMECASVVNFADFLVYKFFYLINQNCISLIQQHRKQTALSSGGLLDDVAKFFF